MDGNLVSWLLIGLAAAASISGFMALRRDHELTRQAVDDGDLPAARYVQSAIRWLTLRQLAWGLQLYCGSSSPSGLGRGGP